MRYNSHEVSKRRRSAESMARNLGWFSIGLGLVEATMPRALARWLGLRGHERIIAGFGLREIATGIGILLAEDPTPWMWGRVGGDALDIGALSVTLGQDDTHRGAASIALATVAGVTALDVACARALGEPEPAPMRTWDYRDRRGMPKAPDAMRGAARDYEVPKDFRIPEPLRPYGQGNGHAAH